jgi:hypothetical protein
MLSSGCFDLPNLGLHRCLTGIIVKKCYLDWHCSQKMLSCGCLLAGGGAAADVTAWCEFHNGVAAGIKVLPRRRRRLVSKQQLLQQQGHEQHHQQQYPAGRGGGTYGFMAIEPEDPLADAWLPHSKPAVPNYAHAGVLLGLGLTGHLDRLSWAELYRSATIKGSKFPYV